MKAQLDVFSIVTRIEASLGIDARRLKPAIDIESIEPEKAAADDSILYNAVLERRVDYLTVHILEILRKMLERHR